MSALTKGQIAELVAHSGENSVCSKAASALLALQERVERMEGALRQLRVDAGGSGMDGTVEFIDAALAEGEKP